MENTIYDYHDAAFRHVSAYVAIARGNNLPTIKIAFKFPKDGAGRLYAYVHILGLEMTRDYAGGYGYDKKSAAVAHAIAKIKVTDDSQFAGLQWYETSQIAKREQLATIQAAFENIGGKDWDSVFREIGYEVIQAV